MKTHPYSGYFYDSLPIAGVDGTIKYRMRETPAENNVHAKTGFITSCRCLSGYVTTKSGRDLVFSMMVNNYMVPTQKANKLQDTAVSYLASLDF